MFIYSHNEASEGAKELGAALKAKRIKHEGSAFRGGPDKIVINWGARNLPPEVLKCRILNSVGDITQASDKLRFFRKMSVEGGPRIPEFTSDQAVAVQWVADGNLVVARRVLSGHSGEGIHFMSLEHPASNIAAPLYTKYIKKKHEYRIHFVNGQIIDVQRKALRPGVNTENVDWKVRNLHNGFIFVRNDVVVPPDVTLQAQRTIALCGLDFGAIDLIWNEQQNLAYVLEVNTAPGITGTTTTNYATAFKGYEQ